MMIEIAKLTNQKKVVRKLKKLQKEKTKKQLEVPTNTQEQDLQEELSIERENLEELAARRHDEGEEKKIAEQIRKQEDKNKERSRTEVDSDDDDSDISDSDEDDQIDMNVQQPEAINIPQQQSISSSSDELESQIDRKRKYPQPISSESAIPKKLLIKEIISSNNDFVEIKDMIKTLSKRIDKLERKLDVKKSQSATKSSDQNPTTSSTPTNTALTGKSAFRGLKDKWVPQLLTKLEGIHKDIKTIMATK